MSRLIDDLKAEHLQIIRLVQDARFLGLSSPEGIAELSSGKALILAHLETEDAKLYPAMWAHPETNSIANKFSDEMKGLVETASELFTVVEDGQTGPDVDDLLGRVASALIARIAEEEMLLFPAYDSQISSVAVRGSADSQE
ncbi:MAG: hemerythrin domain-containing protein [Acidimicrobiales bacterium]